jgi:hypothetical protein
MEVRIGLYADDGQSADDQTADAAGAQDNPAAIGRELVIFSGPFTASYAAEWHTGVIDELLKLKPSWAKQVLMVDDQLSELGLKPIVDSVAKGFEQPDLPGVDPVHRSFLVRSFSRDAVVAAWMAAAVQVTCLFQPLLEAGSQLDYRQASGGESALAILTPSVAALSWENIAEFREHPGSQQARAKLAEIADALCVSRRTLYAALSPDDEGIAAEIRRQRLERAHTMLRPLAVGERPSPPAPLQPEQKRRSRSRCGDEAQL